MVSNYISLTIQLNISLLFTLLNKQTQTVLFDPLIGPYQVLPLWTKIDLEVLAMNGYSIFPKAPALLEPHHQMVLCYIQDNCLGGLTPQQNVVGVFYSPSKLGCIQTGSPSQMQPSRWSHGKGHLIDHQKVRVDRI